MLAHDVRGDVDRAWDAVWSSGVTNPVVVSDLLGTLLMAGADETGAPWAALQKAVSRGAETEVANLLASVRRQYGIPAGSEIEAPGFWETDHSLLRAMSLLGAAMSARGDILGDIYEHILSKLSLAGHFGQFRTPRHIVDFMVELIDPQESELVVDPACGSGGFLVSTSDYRKRLGREGAELGIEIDRTIARIARANTVFHGMSRSEILRGDGLTHEWEQAPGVVLANPPFAGAVSGNTAGRFHSGSSRTELLFVESIARSLAPGGRAAVVVPGGVMTGGSTAARYVRRLLLEQNSLDAVIELPSGVFRPYTGVKTAILVWRNAPCDGGRKVKMIRVEADGFSMDARRVPVEANDLPAAIRALRGESTGLAMAEADPESIAATGYILNPSRYIGVKADGVPGEERSLEQSCALLGDSVRRISAKLAEIEELMA